MVSFYSNGIKKIKNDVILDVKMSRLVNLKFHANAIKLEKIKPA